MPGQSTNSKDLYFSAYVAALKQALKNNRASETVISKLYSLVAIPARLDGKGGRTIDCPKSTASDIMHRRSNAHHDIRNHSHDAEVIDSIGDRFKSVFSNDLHEARIPELIETVSDLVEHSSIRAEARENLLRLSNEDDIWDFLGLAYLESLQPENKISANDTVDSNAATIVGNSNVQMQQPTTRKRTSSEELTAALLEEYRSAGKRRISLSEVLSHGKFGMDQIMRDIENGFVEVDWDQNIKPKGTAPSMTPSLENDYYQLLVVPPECDLESGIAGMWGSRAFTEHYVPKDLLATCKPSTPDGKRKLKQIPAIICKMSFANEGNINPKEKAIYARITNVFDIDRGNGSKDLEIRFEKLATFPLEKACTPGVAQFFGIQLSDRFPTYTQIGWYIFQRNLWDAFEAAGIDGMPAF